jgi:hypothetical protein
MCPETLVSFTLYHSQPTLVVWGAKDPWENVKDAQKLFAGWAAVTDFVVLPGRRLGLSR